MQNYDVQHIRGHEFRITVFASCADYLLAYINWKSCTGMDVATAPVHIVVLEKGGRGIAFYPKEQRSQHQAKEACVEWIKQQYEGDDANVETDR